VSQRIILSSGGRSAVRQNKRPVVKAVFDRAAGELCILGHLKYFERYSEKGRVPAVRTQSAFGLQGPWGSQGSEQRQEGDFGPRDLVAEYFWTGVPVCGFIRASGNSERCNMTGNEVNVGFLATGSGVQQFQLSLRGCSVLQRRRLSRELRSAKHTTNLRASAAVLHGADNSGSQDTVRGTPALSVLKVLFRRHASACEGA
jgi:hypothetical protein